MFTRTLILVFLVSITACCTSKKTATAATSDTSDKQEVMMSDAKMIEAGFKQGTIEASTVEGDCPFVIKMDGEQSYFLDPINLEETYKKDGMKLWFTFRPLRMANRCKKANPVEIEDMQLRVSKN